MQSVGTGRMIAGRYQLQERRAHKGDLEVWSGTDTAAHGPVSLTVFSGSVSHADAALDAARRAAVVDDPRLVAVLDVGDEQGLAYIVEESLDDSATLAHLLQDGPFGADESRRVAGEIAAVLDVAGRRGLHHLHLSPYAVRRDGDGRIRLAGLATAAAFEGTEASSPEQAELVDAKGVVAVLYAALTACWPLKGSMPGLAAAPRIVGGVAAPSEIVAGVPADLDLLCRTVLNDQPGPVSPGELAAQIAPWPDHPTDAAAPHDADLADDTDGRLGADAETMALPLSEPLRTIPEVGSAPADPTDLRETRTVAETAEPTPSAGEPIVGSVEPVTGAGEPVTDESVWALADKPPTQPLPPAPSIGERFAQTWRSATTRVGRLREQRATERTQSRNGADEAGQRVLLDRALHEGPSAPLQSPTPLGATQPQQRDGEHTRFVLSLVAGLIVIAMLIAVPTLFRSVTSTASPTPPPPATSKRSAPPSPGPVKATGAPLPIQTATGFDPLGDGTENGSQAPLSYDGDPNTAWTSEGYRGSPEMGGTKDGVGVIYTLARGSKISTARLTLASKPQDVTVYVSSDRALDVAQELGKVANATGQQTITSKVPLAGRYVIVWFTKAAAEDGDRYRCSLAEVAFSQ